MEVLPLKWIRMLTTEMKSEKKAILGGTFDPVHIGHINLFHSISEFTDITTLYVIPAYVSAFKKGKKSASFSDRMAMLNLAIIDYADIYPLDALNIVVSDFEGKKKGIIYTSETIRELFDKLEDNGKVNFVIGDDLIEGLPRWHDYEYLKSHVRFYCFTRDGGEKKNLEGVEVIYIDSPQTIASSTMFRDGEEGLVTPSVMEYIESEGLYQNKR